MFSPTSRYANLDTDKYINENGKEIVYVQRRLLPQQGSGIAAEHTVTEGDRLDNITAKYLGDPEQFWRICDANLAMDPALLTSEIGRQLDIPIMQGGTQ